MEDPGSDTIKQRSLSQAPEEEETPPNRNYIVTNKH